MEMSFVPISVDEVNELRDIALKTFKQAYEHLNTPSNFEWYVQKSFTHERLKEEIVAENSFFYFIKIQEEIIGYLKLNIGDSQTEVHTNDFLEIERIYLDVKHQRRGIGSKMIQFTLDKARELNKSKVWLGVWDQNPAAIKFYQKVGFHLTGSHIFRFGDEDQTDYIMEKHLD